MAEILRRVRVDFQVEIYVVRHRCLQPALLQSSSSCVGRRVQHKHQERWSLKSRGFVRIVHSLHHTPTSIYCIIEPTDTMADGIADIDNWIDPPERSGSRNQSWRRAMPFTYYYSSCESLNDWWSEDSLSCWSEEDSRDADDGCHNTCQRDVKRCGCTGYVGNQVNVVRPSRIYSLQRGKINQLSRSVATPLAHKDPAEQLIKTASAAQSKRPRKECSRRQKRT